MTAMASESLRLERYYDRLATIRFVARLHGYAIGIHGSTQRDFDLIAVPWVENVSPPEVMIEAVRKAIDGVIEYGREGRDPTIRPHGRKSWSIHIGGRLYFDVSVFGPEERTPR